MKPQFSPQAIMTTVSRKLNCELSKWEPVSEGEESQAFAVSIGENECIIRVNRSANDFYKDAFCSRQFASSDLLIPEIIHIGALDVEYTYCVSRRAQGVTLQDLPSSELPYVVRSVMQVMEVMANANCDGTTGFGPFDEHGVGRFASWHDFIMSITDSTRYNWDALSEGVVDSNRLAPYFKALEAFAPRCPEIRKLVHGDFGSNNVLTYGARITGVIDWSEALFGDPLYDVANIFFWRTWLDCMEVQAQFIEEQHRELTGRTEELRCYQLRIGLYLIFQSASAGDTEMLEWALKRCDAIVGDEVKHNG
ncbi:phosphotransferase family protein [Paenibacillus sp. OV219]|uniref:phosphotransferase family protein n=1 Tax=Paenibacillus sp. OV219 TaxID=1884377 RepID=UPI0008B812B7|nr:aminoglycoside phosphotransferase family protein [Paenibacillus sp. OV219]SEO00133.1 hygromycin-B 4-O-kinase [Paenibacillus sp. OV219]